MIKRLLLILLCLPFIGFGQITYVPDDASENYLEAMGYGNGIPLLASCSKSNPQPTCEEGGVEVKK